ncbi:MAG: hypothetical protein IJQ82_06370 [Selenomonadaceae bacterium]|nr:hypothetical protein [Selenomonadaceae bacterium]
MARPKTLTDPQKKSARVSLLMTAAFYDDVVTLAQIQKTSLNELFLSAAEQLVKKNRRAIDEVQATMARVSPSVQASLFDDDE